MNIKEYNWEKGFLIISLALLISVPLGYFLSSLAFGIWFVYSLSWGITKRFFKLKTESIPFILFSLFGISSIIWSQDGGNTTKAIIRQAPLFFFAVATLFLPKVDKNKIISLFRIFTLFIAGFGLILIILAFFKYQKYQYLGFLYYHELVSPLELNAIYVSYIVSTCFLFKLQLFKRTKLEDYISLILLGVFLVMLISKMVLFITFLLALLIVIRKFRKKIKN